MKRLREPKAAVKCLLCEDCGWVCEAHPDRPWEANMSAAAVALALLARTVTASEDDTAPRMPKASRPNLT